MSITKSKDDGSLTKKYLDNNGIIRVKQFLGKNRLLLTGTSVFLNNDEKKDSDYSLTGVSNVIKSENIYITDGSYKLVDKITHKEKGTLLTNKIKLLFRF